MKNFTKLPTDGNLNDPNIETLAMLAAQARFANLTPEAAARSALALWLECVTVLESNPTTDETPSAAPENKVVHSPQKPKLKTWPLPLNKFLADVVRGKDEGKSKQRLLQFLPGHILATSSGPDDRPLGQRANELLAYWKTNGVDEPTFEWLVPSYLKWWHETGRLQGKSRGGKTRASERAKELKKSKSK